MSFNLKEKWADPNFRKFVVVCLIGLFAIPLYHTMSNRKEFKPLEERIAERKAEDRVDDKGRVKGLFDTNEISNLDQDEFNEIYKESADALQVRERRIYQEKEKVLAMVEQLQKDLDAQSLELKNLKRQQEINAKAKAPRTPANRQQSNGQRKNTKRNSQPDNMTAYNNAIETVEQVDQRVFDRTPATFVTAKPQIEGKVIRTITQRSVRSIKKTGEIEEKSHDEFLITQKEQTPKEAVKQPKNTKDDGGLVDANEGTVYLPAGSFFSGVLLTGLDAPTQLAAKKSPMPVIIRVKKEAILPNHFTLDIRECHVIGQAIGDLSSERAHIRAQSITCVREDGRSVESAIQANAVSDYDGKLGIAGRLVSKNGNLLAGSMAAGFMSGISQAVAPRRSLSVNTEPGDQDLWQTVDYGSVAAAGVFQGASNAMDRLAEYYIELAEQIHPVIEISPGRSISFAVISGAKLKLGD
ncbi:TraB/VirB10 family protein [Pseudoalteromonas spongiae]|uniref:TraB/VirB10 family protein n=1 Tax=Pseudoalteromonas spongiae TaxID=298657 RepID=UPI000C2D4979|nr:TraB/VirB10 family protein [Pseudoalteromonas spongiae]